jgi:hypothetical protein
MVDLTQNYYLQQILVEAAQYRTVRAIYKSDPHIGPGTAALLRRVFSADRDDTGALRKIATER